MNIIFLQTHLNSVLRSMCHVLYLGYLHLRSGRHGDPSHAAAVLSLLIGRLLRFSLKRLRDARRALVKSTNC